MTATPEYTLTHIRICTHTHTPHAHTDARLSRLHSLCFQVSIFMSLLPKKILEKGKNLTNNYLSQMEQGL